MTALSIHIPDDLAKASQEAAHTLGISRSSFIRMAISRLEFNSLHVQLTPRDNLQVTSYALTEHNR